MISILVWIYSGFKFWILSFKELLKHIEINYSFSLPALFKKFHILQQFSHFAQHFELLITDRYLKTTEMMRSYSRIRFLHAPIHSSQDLHTIYVNREEGLIKTDHWSKSNGQKENCKTFIYLLHSLLFPSNLQNFILIIFVTERLMGWREILTFWNLTELWQTVTLI